MLPMKHGYPVQMRHDDIRLQSKYTSHLYKSRVFLTNFLPYSTFILSFFDPHLCKLNCSSAEYSFWYPPKINYAEVLNLIADTCYSTTGHDCLSVLFQNLLKVFLLLPICDQKRITVAKLLIQIGLTNSYHVVGTEGTVKSCKPADNDNNVSSPDGMHCGYGI